MCCYVGTHKKSLLLIVIRLLIFQVMQMMPGGLDVIGLYAAASTKELEKNASKLRQVS
jgi:hypothetical protein